MKNERSDELADSETVTEPISPNQVNGPDPRACACAYQKQRASVSAFRQMTRTFKVKSERSDRRQVARLVSNQCPWCQARIRGPAPYPTQRPSQQAIASSRLTTLLDERYARACPIDESEDDVVAVPLPPSTPKPLVLDTSTDRSETSENEE